MEQPEFSTGDTDLDALLGWTVDLHSGNANQDVGMAWKVALDVVVQRLQTAPEPLTDDRINRIAELVIKTMPDGISGFCKTWGWQQFARELLDVCKVRSAPAETIPCRPARPDLPKMFEYSEPK